MIKNLQNMKAEEQTICDFDMNIVYEYFSNVERQGPGSPEITLKALSFIDNLTSTSRIADIRVIVFGSVNLILLCRNYFVSILS